MVGTWLGEIRSCSCLAVLPDSAWVLLNKIYQPVFTSLYIQLRETTTTIGKLEYKVEKLRDKAEIVADHVADCKLELIGAKFHDEAKARNYKDTHVDLSMEMWILHNNSRDDEMMMRASSFS